MEIEIFTLCDFAQDMNGKMTIVGTFNNLNTNKFPFIYPFCSIALRMRFSNKEAGPHDGKLSFRHNEKDFMPQLNFKLNTPIQQVGHTICNMALNIGNLQISEPGKYTVELYIDNEWVSGLTLFINQIGLAA